MPPARFTPRQLSIVLLIAAVQFVNVLDFVMVMPMGPDFARALLIPESSLGLIGGSYTAAASVSGLLGFFFLDRFDRRKALAVSMLGLVAGTAAGGFATDFHSLLAARILAGAFGGPATSLSFAIVSDVIPNALRGRAMGIVMGAFSIASIFGVPAGLFLAEHQGWRSPFFTVACVGFLVASLAIALLPPLTGHLSTQAKGSAVQQLGAMLRRPLILASWGMTALVMSASFIVIPNISAFVQLNMHFPRERLGSLYLFGGIASFFTTQAAGALVDRFGAFKVNALGVAVVLGVTFSFFYEASPSLGVPLVFVLFMSGMSFRNVSYNTLTSKVPEPAVRARFQSLQSAVQHGSSALAAGLSALLLSQAAAPDGSGERMVGMDQVALVSMALTLAVPWVVLAVEKRVRAKGEPAVAAVPAAS
jgi:predicted MFS family arabinose efflux permease